MEQGKHYFVRDRDGSFHEIVEDPSIAYQHVPQKFHGVDPLFVARRKARKRSEDESQLRVCE